MTLLSIALMMNAAAVASVGPGPARAIDGGREWIYVSDYPRDALRERRGGVVTVEMQVGRDGLVEDCRVTRSSGSADLDARTCEALSVRARYEPARNVQGRRIVSRVQHQVVWDPSVVRPTG